MKRIVLLVAIVVLVAGAFWGGMLYQKSLSPEAESAPAGTPASASSEAPADAPESSPTGAQGADDPLADLTEEERAAMADMTEEERAAFLEEQGIDITALPQGGAGERPDSPPSTPPTQP